MDPVLLTGKQQKHHLTCAQHISPFFLEIGAELDHTRKSNQLLKLAIDGTEVFNEGK